LEEIDRHIVAPVAKALESYGDWRMLVTPDHPTPLRTKTHSHGAVPFTLAGSDVQADAHATYCDEVAGTSELSFPEGWKLMGYFVN
jgi:2,3-bisphosphoglycerate-independent phosphoglycerate mutase